MFKIYTDNILEENEEVPGMKKIGAILLSLVLCISMMPVSAFANTGTNASTNTILTDSATVIGVSGELDKETGNLVLDGDNTSTKWCTKSKTGWIAIEIAQPACVDSMKIYHASGGKDWDNLNAGNIKDYSLQILKEGRVLPTDAFELSRFLGVDDNWETIADVTGNTDRSKTVTEHATTVKKQGKVYRLKVNDVNLDRNGTEDSKAIRVYGIEFYGTLSTDLISFDCGEGSGIMNSVAYNKGGSTTLPYCTFTPPEGKVFQKWTAGGNDYYNSITTSENVVLTAVYAEQPAGTPVMNEDGTHSFGDQKFACQPSAKSHKDKDSHYIDCVCGRHIYEEAHTAGGPYTYDTNDTHKGVCTVCGDTVKGLPCEYDNFTDNGDGTHTATCSVCGHAKTEEHNIYYDSYENGTHKKMCTECDAYLAYEKCTPGTEKSEADVNGTYHYSVCEFCGEPLLNTAEKHTYKYIADYVPDEEDEELVPPDGMNYKLGVFSCTSECGNSAEYFYQENPDKMLIQLINYYKNPGSSQLVVTVNGKDHILDPSDVSYDAIEVNKTDKIVVRYISKNPSELDFAIVDGNKNVIEFNNDIRDFVYHKDILYTNIPDSDILNFNSLNDTLRTIPDDLSIYTKDSVIALQKAIKKVPDIYKTKDQKVIDKAEAEIKAAINKLVKKDQAGAEAEVKTITLKDGDRLVVNEKGYVLNDKKEEPFTGTYEITGTADKVKIAEGYHNVIVNNLIIANDNESPFEISKGAGAYITLKGETSSFTTISDYAALCVAEDAELFLDGDGKLNAVCSKDENGYLGNGAGIGGSMYKPAGNIVIYGGDITAISEDDGAGIGGGYKGDFDTIKIFGGTINARSESDGAGIGCGEDRHGKLIAIHGGNITAYSDDEGAGIGGADYGTPDKILITGGTIHATGDEGAGIGGGDDSERYMEVVITGGNIIADADEGAGIGSGEDSDQVAVIKISGGTIDAKADDGAGIGSGEDSDVEIYINITGGDITAKADEGAGIGTGEESDLFATEINISGGKITSEADEGAAIGMGEDADNPCTINISGGEFVLESDDGACIGSGDDSEHAIVNITGGYFNLDTSNEAGIGGGSYQDAGELSIKNAVIFADSSCSRVIGNDSSSDGGRTFSNYVKLENVTVFEDNELLEDGINFEPYPEAFDGGKVAYLTADSDREDGWCTIKLPDGTYTDSFVKNGKISVIVKEANADPSKIKVIDLMADYTKVNEALAGIPEDLSLYNKDDAAKVNAAKDAVVFELPRTRQAEVDKMASDVEAAVKALKYKNADYTEVSKAIEKAKALEPDLFEDFSKVEAAVKAVVPGKNITEQKAVDKMAEDILSAIKALVRITPPTVDKNTGKTEVKGKDDKVILAPSEVTSAKEIICDFGNNKTVKYDKGAIEKIKEAVPGATKVEIVLEEVDKYDEMNEAQKKAVKENKGKKVFEITLKITKADGTVTEVHDFAGGKSTISVPYKAPAKGMTYEVYRVEKDGTLKLMNSSFKDGILTWITDGHSYYMVKEVAVADASKPGADKTETPETGDTNNLIPWVIALAVALAGGVFLVARRKKDK